MRIKRPRKKTSDQSKHFIYVIHFNSQIKKNNFMDLENEYRETKRMKTATNSAPTTPLNYCFIFYKYMLDTLKFFFHIEIFLYFPEEYLWFPLLTSFAVLHIFNILSCIKTLSSKASEVNDWAAKYNNCC